MIDDRLMIWNRARLFKYVVASAMRDHLNLPTTSQSYAKRTAEGIARAHAVRDLIEIGVLIPRAFMAGCTV